MSNRFTNTNKWKDSWFIDLSLKSKILFIFLCDNCDIAGFYERSNKLMKFYLDMSLEEIDKSTKEISKSVVFKNNKYFIKNFIFHQKNIPLNPNNNCHKSIINILSHNKEDFSEYYSNYFRGSLAPSKPLVRGPGNSKGNSKGKGKGKGKGKKIIYDFEKIWNKYPIGRKQGKKEALGYFKETVKTNQDFENINKAIDNYNNYVKSKISDPIYILKACNWFDDWESWIDYVEIKSQSEKNKELDEYRKKMGLI